MDIEERVRKSFLDQAMWCGKLGSPFMERLMRILGENLDHSTQSGSRILSWQGVPDATGDAVGLRLAGALHALSRKGELSKLEPFYQDHSQFTDDEMVAAFASAMTEKDHEINRWLDHAPQTNEVRRSSIIFAALTELAAMHDLPIALYELGASGGLNLQMAEFSYDFDCAHYGKASSGVKLQPQWQGALPANSKVEVVSRKGCDINPLSVDRDEDCERLMAYIWPDQFERVERTQEAIKIAKLDPPHLEKSDAAEWLENTLENENSENVLRVVFHTIAWQYFPTETKLRIEKAMHVAGAAASSSPLAWLSFEMAENNKPVLTVQYWPSGEKMTLAEANAHVSSIKWHGKTIK